MWLIALALAGLLANVAGAGQAQLALHRDAHPVFAELRHPQFVVAFSKQSAPDDITGRLIPMRDVNGSRYSCYVPQPEREQQQQHQEGGDGGGGGGEQVAPEQSLVSQKTPEELLDSLTDWCTYRLEDWWHYEVCYKKHVRQFHKEGSNLVSEYKLGSYDAAASNVNTVHTDASDVSGGAKYVSQQYTGGEPCELTGQPRSAEVRYQCGPDGDSVISSLLEPRSCHYLITIRTPRLCKHPAFREQPLAVGIIKCYLERPAGGEAAAAAAADAAAEETVDGAAAAAAAGECPAGGDAGTCAAPAAAAGEGGHRRHVSPERVTASGPAGAGGEGLEDGRGDEGEGDGQHPRLLKTLLRHNGLDDEEGDDDDGYEAPE